MFKKTRKNKAGRLHTQSLTGLINNMADAIVAVDNNINILMFNGSALNIIDVNNIEIGTALNKLLKPVDETGNIVDIVKLINHTKEPLVNQDLRLNYSDGSQIRLYISVTPIHIGYGEEGQSGFVLLLRDITREKSLEEERDEFISVVSHELRTPVTIAEGNISNAILVANKSNLSDSIIKALNSAHGQVLNLAEMINDLSTLSRAERRTLPMEVGTIKVKQLVREMIDNYTPEAKRKGLKITSEIDPNLDTLYSSQLYAREILQNFITNSLKYTESGQIIIRAYPQRNGVKFEVIDSGIGISKADQERVFDKFFRSEDQRIRQVNGTGLGLYVTMKLVHLIHAEVSIHSELNHGSTFTVFIPNLD